MIIADRTKTMQRKFSEENRSSENNRTCSLLMRFSFWCQKTLELIPVLQILLIENISA